MYRVRCSWTVWTVGQQRGIRCLFSSLQALLCVNRSCPRHRRAMLRLLQRTSALSRRAGGWWIGDNNNNNNHQSSCFFVLFEALKSPLLSAAATSLQCRPFQIARGDSDSGARKQRVHPELRPLQIHFHPPGTYCILLGDLHVKISSKSRSDCTSHLIWPFRWDLTWRWLMMGCQSQTTALRRTSPLQVGSCCFLTPERLGTYGGGSSSGGKSGCLATGRLLVRSLCSSPS